MQEWFKLSLLFLLQLFFFFLKKLCFFFFLITKIMLVHCGNEHKATGIKGKAEFSQYVIHSYSTIVLPRMAFASFIAPNLTMHQQHLSTPTIKLRFPFCFIPTISLHIYISTNCFNTYIFCHLNSTKQAPPTLALESR